MIGGRRAWRLWAPVALLSLAVPGGLRAEDRWYELYQDALKSIGSRKWSEAERRLKAAMASGPPSGRQVRSYGTRFLDYLPEYQLGRVYFAQQRYADALEQFAKVQTSALVNKGDPEFQPLTDMVELCRLRTPATAADGQKEAEALVRFARDLMGRGNLEEARRALDEAAVKDPGGKDVRSARDDLVRVETEKRMRAEQEARAAKEARPPANLAPSPPPTPPPSRVERAPTPTPATPAPVSSVQTSRRDPTRERAAFTSFYAGEYATAADSFERLVVGSPTAGRERLLVYAACSRAAAALLRGKAGEAELERAKRLFAEAGKLGPRLVAQDAFVSPRIARALGMLEPTPAGK